MPRNQNISEGEIKMKIAILNCAETGKRCAGTGCLRALHERTGGFEQYAGRDLVLTAYCLCSHCGAAPEEDPDMVRKLGRIVEAGTQAVHIGKCAKRDGVRCAAMEAYARWLEEKGIRIVWRTH